METSPEKSKSKNNKSAMLILLTTMTTALILSIALILIYDNPKKKSEEQKKESPGVQSSFGTFKKFQSEAEFKQYISQTNTSSGAVGFNSLNPSLERMQTMDLKNAPAADAQSGRASQTNVQVLGIDEPDMVKNNNKNIFLSRSNNVFYPVDLRSDIRITNEKLMPVTQQIKQEVAILNAFPPETLSKIGKIDASGDLLLSGNNLTILAGNRILGYDIASPTQPKELWTMDIKEGNYIQQSRMYENKAYIMVASSLNSSRPCPIEPLAFRDRPISIPCTDVFYPTQPARSDVTYTLMKINPTNGEIENKVSFIGSTSESTLFMSTNSLYVSYPYEPNYVEFLSKFIDERAGDLLPEEVKERVRKLNSYELSNATKTMELMNILQPYLYQVPTDNGQAQETEVQKKLIEYSKERRRELDRSGIVKINLNNFTVANTISIPGKALNQFSLDEYNEDLRIATTVGGNFMFGQNESTNDLYILDKNLKSRGQIQDMGVGERIYSARFMGNRAFLVTFKQIDPFYVLDLSNPDKPEIKGELKIPGYSSYLHPLSENIILGIGKEDAYVKASLFDVTNPSTPTEVSKYTLTDFHSDTLYNHHAFLHDKEHQVFFIPGEKSGYVFSYKDNKLALAKNIPEQQTQRALYMDNFMYFVGNNKVSVYNEENWDKVKEITLD